VRTVHSTLAIIAQQVDTFQIVDLGNVFLFQRGERFAQRRMVSFISLATSFHQESGLHVAILDQQNRGIGVSVAEQLYSRNGALGDIRQAIQHEDSGVEFGHELQHLRFHAPVAGEAEIDHLAIKRPPEHGHMRHARARCPDPMRD